MKNLFFIILFFLTATFYAQVNIERYNNLNKIEGLMGNLSFYISSKTGNTNIQEFGVDGRINYKGESYYSIIIAQGEYGWNKGNEFSNQALLHLRYLKDLSSNIKAETYGQINYNKSRLLLFRYLGGAGLRVTAISDTLMSLDLGSSYMYEYENLDLDKTAKHPSETYHHRWSNYISFSSSLSDNSRLSIVIYAQPRLDDFNDIRVLSENNLGVSLTNKLSLTLNFSVRFDNQAPDGVRDIDTNTKVGFTIKF